jgi:hypothetical protein
MAGQRLKSNADPTRSLPEIEALGLDPTSNLE